VAGPGVKVVDAGADTIVHKLGLSLRKGRGHGRIEDEHRDGPVRDKFIKMFSP
jgi:hypothetical protein